MRDEAIANSDGAGPHTRAWHAVRSMPRSWLYSGVGAVLALGAPIGLVLAHGLAAGGAPTLAWALEDLARFPVTYAYLTLSSVVVLAVLGGLLGRWFDRAHLLSITDPLTGLFNRRHFGDRLEQEARRGRRYRHSVSLLSVDLDRLKAINAGFGHKAGDDALISVSRILSRSVRATDVVARVGGDEFAVLLPETGQAEASTLSQRILAEVARHNAVLTKRLAVSIGIAELKPTGNAGAQELLAAADAALYRAKTAGRGHAAVAQLSPATPSTAAFTLGDAALVAARL